MKAIAAIAALADPVTGDLVEPYNDFSTKEPAAPGATREYHVELPPIGNRFAAGHRIRLYVVGTSAYMEPPPPGVNSLSIGPAMPSRLLLPSYQGSSGITRRPSSGPSRPR